MRTTQCGVVLPVVQALTAAGQEAVFYVSSTIHALELELGVSLISKKYSYH